MRSNAGITLITAPPKSIVPKELGAFYTPPQVADFLVRWAIRSHADRVLDPSFGGGVFLKAAADRIKLLGGDVARSVFGVELDPESHGAAFDGLLSLGISPDHLSRGDFFSPSVCQCDQQLDAVVGNPPFIRYQQFNGAVRERAAAVMRHQGVKVNELASSWAPFVVGAASLLRTGGRLAMVVPMELCHASYALPVLEYLSRSFELVQFLSFGQRIFPHLSQDTLLLLADHKGAAEAQFRWKHLPDADALDAFPSGKSAIPRASTLDAAGISSGRERLIEQFMPQKARELYAELRNHPAVRPLGAIADVGIGYVTGANEFFHLSESDVQRWEIPPRFLRRAVCRGRALSALRFTSEDWAKALSEGSAGYLLSLTARDSIPASVRRYLQHGEQLGVHRAYKCRVRSIWYSVPHVHQPDALLTYMSGVSPRLVANEAAVVAPNTLHVLRMLPLLGVGAHALAAGWQSALTELSVEIEGHAMGGGMLKLEPAEAGRVLVALPSVDAPRELCHSLDQISRHATAETARLTIDRMVLRDQIGLTAADCRLLTDAARLLRGRRYSRPGGILPRRISKKRKVDG